MAHKVYLGRLPAAARQRDIERFFEGYGRIHDVVIKNGFGFCEFEDGRDAVEAVEDLNGKSMLGERVLIQHANTSIHRNSNNNNNNNNNNRRGTGRPGGNESSRGYGPPTRTEYRVRIENLSSRCSWQDLKDYLNRVGEVCYCDCNNSRMNEGVAEFSTLGDMKNVITKLNGKEFYGRNIRIVDDRDSSRSPYRGRSRSRSRSSRSLSRSRSRSKSPY